MSYTVRIRKGAATLYTFVTTPFVIPQKTYETDDNDPPSIVAVTYRWSLEGVLYGKEGTTASELPGLWDALTSVFESVASYPDSIELLSGATIVQQISVSGNGFNYVRVEVAESPHTEDQWRERITFKIGIVGKKRLVPGGKKIVEEEDFAYDEAGLLARTLSGEVETGAGTSATAYARTLGLTLPDATYGFLTKGPEGVDVRRLNSADTKARYVSAIKQNGAALPGNVGPNYSQETETETEAGKTTVSVRVQAVGPGAEAAVDAAKPGTFTRSRKVVNNNGRVASAIYTTETPDATLTSRHTFTITGGGKGLAWSLMSGDRTPEEHVLPRSPVQVSESYTTQLKGSPVPGDFKVPQALSGVKEDEAKREIVPMSLIARGASGRSGDIWEAGVRRFYGAADMSGVFSAISDRLADNGAGTVSLSSLGGGGGQPGGDISDMLGIVGFEAPRGPPGASSVAFGIGG